MYVYIVQSCPHYEPSEIEEVFESCEDARNYVLEQIQLIEPKTVYNLFLDNIGYIRYSSKGHDFNIERWEITQKKD